MAENAFQGRFNCLAIPFYPGSVGHTDNTEYPQILSLMKILIFNIHGICDKCGQFQKE